MGCVPLSLETYAPLLPLKEIVPSAFVIQSNCSHGPIAVRLRFIACEPFSEHTYFLWLIKAIFPFPAFTTVNCSQDCATVRLQFMGWVPFSEHMYRLLELLRVIV